jgi:hypothetical protein
MAPYCPEPSRARRPEKVFGGQKTGNVWQLTQPHSAVGFPVDPNELRKMTLSFTTPKTLPAGTSTKVRITQRKDHKIITGGVTLELTVESIQALGPRKRAKR